MAITVGTTTTNSFDNRSSLTTTHNSNDCDLIVVCIRVFNTVTISQIKYNNVSLTLARQVSNPDIGEIIAVYYLVNPSSGSNDLYVSISATGRIYLTITNLTGIDKNNPLGVTGGEQNSGTTATATLTGVSTGSIAFGICVSVNTLTLGSGQTEISSWANGHYIKSSYKALTADTTMTSTFSAGYYAIAAAEFKALPTNSSPAFLLNFIN